MKKYFISIEFGNTQTGNKFIFGIIDADITQESLLEIAGRIIKENIVGSDIDSLNTDDLNIHVVAFNNIS